MQRAEEKGIVRKVFVFVDATVVKSKETTWEQRDKAIKDGEESLNNNNVENYSADKDARFGCKGKNKFWYGYKKHVSVDMGSGLIQKVAVTPANTTEQDGLKHICPDGGMVFADKAYCYINAQNTMSEHNCHSGAILKNNMKAKNKDKDRWLTKVRAPFESIFSKDEKRARYRGIMKNQLQAFMDAIVFNVKRLLTINAPPLFAGA
jgi:IS5 family transposase